MFKLKNDPFYRERKTYRDCLIDYCLIQDEEQYEGEASHRKALLFAMDLYSSQCEKDTGEPLEYDQKKMKAEKTDAGLLLVAHMDDDYDSYYAAFIDPAGKPPARRVFEDGHQEDIPYTDDDFNHFSSLLFPEGTDHLEAYEWNTEWSEYFNPGNMGFGSGCWTFYDRKLSRFTVITYGAYKDMII